MPTYAPTFSRSNILVLGTNSVLSLLPATLISQVESLLDSHRIEDAVNMAEQQRKKLQGNITVDNDETDELRYVYQRIGFQCLTETLFDDAGRHLFDGGLDPRTLLSYFPELCGSLFETEDSVDLFSGIAECMPSEESMDDIILNYSPHLAPNTKTAPPAVELRNVLKLTATDMLKIYLRKWRRKRRTEDTGANGKGKLFPEMRAVDTVLAKLYTESEDISELNKLIEEPNEIVLSELEPYLTRYKHISLLCQLYKQRGEDLKLLEAWSRLVSGEWIDTSFSDPLGSMLSLLGEKRDRALIQRWGVWLTKYDPDRALKLLISSLSGKRAKLDDELILLRQIQDTSPLAGTLYLEHLVLTRRLQEPGLHNQVATEYVSQLLGCLTDESTSKLWRAKAASYSSSHTETPFLSYFASTTPESESKRIRLKTILFLSGSSLYDPPPIRDRLLEHQKVFALELAILEGKRGNDLDALNILVHILRDSTSAETFCALGGEVVPSKTAQSLGERFGLQQWFSLFVPPSSGKGRAGALAIAQAKSQKSVNEERKRELVKVLLEVYMNGTEPMVDRAVSLLNAQAVNLDVAEVLQTIPPTWPLQTLSTFLSRSFRRTLHTHHESLLVKAIASCENLEVSERTWEVLREQGAIVEEVGETEDGESVTEGVPEKVGGLGLELDEKAGLGGGVVDIPPLDPAP